ncbi:hypothetical protein ACFHYQ_07625 [Sphaerimonospora cavernae]|uniref:Uncharacterized protein n=1 Tax=Sphaerimonospora cavernae TaxID=1740611 RepID=A0ABV6U118_9ACTN
MSVEPPLSNWARDTFGTRAALVRQGVAEALQVAMENAQDAQKVAQTGHLHPFGFTLMSRKFEALARTFEDMSDVQIVRPIGSQHELVVLSGKLLFPFRYAKDRSVNVMDARISDDKPSALIQALFGRFGPEPTLQQLALDVLDDAEASNQTAAPVADALSHLPEGTKLVLVGYACNAKAGLLDAWWGEAELLDRAGYLRWHHCEEIPLAKGLPPGGRLPGSLAGPIAPSDAPAFDQGAMPSPSLTPRSPVERKHAESYPPVSEAQTLTPDTANNEGQ